MATTNAPNDTGEQTQQAIPWRRTFLGLVAVTVLGIVIPGGGLILALVFFFTAFRHHPVSKWLAVGLGLVLLAGAIFAYGPRTGQEFEVTRTTVVQ